MLAPETAWDLIEQEIQPLDTTSCSRREALGRVLAEDLKATVHVPFADVSAMDGYVAAGAVDQSATHAVIGVSAAGRPPSFEMPAGSVAKIMTGAVVPKGGDRVVPIELTDGGKENVRFDRLTDEGAHIRRQGEVVRLGEPLLHAGHHVNTGSISLLASHGYSQVPVVRRPTVSILTTGDEVVPPETVPGPGQLRDSNSPYLLAAGDAMGLTFNSLGNAGDSLESLRTGIRDGLQSDVLLMCGGVSKGDYDLVEDVLEEMGCRKLFDAVAIQPGKPLVACRHPKGWVFGLPGNPGSVMTTFQLYVRPLLHRLAGISDGFWRGTWHAELTESLPPGKGRDRFFNALLESRDGKLYATPLRPKGSHDVTCFARSNGLVRLPKGHAGFAQGEICEAMFCDRRL